MRRILRIILKSLAGLLALVAVLIVILIVINQFDEDLDPGIEAYFHMEPVADKDNGFVAYTGLAAPEGEDIVAYGRKILDAHSGNPEKRALFDKEIAFKGNEKLLTCWTNPNWTKAGDSCADANTIRTMMQDNQLLLSRYMSLIRYPSYTYKFPGSFHNGQLILNLQQLLDANMILNAREGRFDEAVNEWKQTMRMLQHIRALQVGIVESSIYLVTQKIHTNALSIILAQATSTQIANHATDLNQLLAVPVIGKGGWDVKSSMVRDYSVYKEMDSTKNDDQNLQFLLPDWLPDWSMKTVSFIGAKIARLFYLPNATKNTYYKFSMDMVTFSEKPNASDLDLLTKYHPFLRLAFWGLKVGNRTIPSQQLYYNPVGKYLISGVAVAADLFKAAHLYTAKNHMLMLYVSAKSQGIAPADMPAFIAKTGGEFINPYTSKPFEWDAAKQQIYFIRADKNREVVNYK